MSSTQHVDTIASIYVDRVFQQSSQSAQHMSASQKNQTAKRSSNTSIYNIQQQCIKIVLKNDRVAVIPAIAIVPKSSGEFDIHTWNCLDTCLKSRRPFVLKITDKKGASCFAKVTVKDFATGLGLNEQETIALANIILRQHQASTQYLLKKVLQKYAEKAPIKEENASPSTLSAASVPSTAVKMQQAAATTAPSLNQKEPAHDPSVSLQETENNSSSIQKSGPGACSKAVEKVQKTFQKYQKGIIIGTLTTTGAALAIASLWQKVSGLMNGPFGNHTNATDTTVVNGTNSTDAASFINATLNNSGLFNETTLLTNLTNATQFAANLPLAKDAINAANTTLAGLINSTWCAIPFIALWNHSNTTAQQPQIQSAPALTHFANNTLPKDDNCFVPYDRTPLKITNFGLSAINRTVQPQSWDLTDPFTAPTQTPVQTLLDSIKSGENELFDRICFLYDLSHSDRIIFADCLNVILTPIQTLPMPASANVVVTVLDSKGSPIAPMPSHPLIDPAPATAAKSTSLTMRSKPLPDLFRTTAKKTFVNPQIAKLLNAHLITFNLPQESEDKIRDALNSTIKHLNETNNQTAQNTNSSQHPFLNNTKLDTLVNATNNNISRMTEAEYADFIKLLNQLEKNLDKAVKGYDADSFSPANHSNLEPKPNDNPISGDNTAGNDIVENDDNDEIDDVEIIDCDNLDDKVNLKNRQICQAIIKRTQDQLKEKKPGFTPKDENEVLDRARILINQWSKTSPIVIGGAVGLGAIFAYILIYKASVRCCKKSNPKQQEQDLQTQINALISKARAWDAATPVETRKKLVQELERIRGLPKNTKGKQAQTEAAQNAINQHDVSFPKGGREAISHQIERLRKKQARTLS